MRELHTNLNEGERKGNSIDVLLRPVSVGEKGKKGQGKGFPASTTFEPLVKIVLYQGKEKKGGELGAIGLILSEKEKPTKEE